MHEGIISPARRFGSSGADQTADRVAAPILKTSSIPCL
jgi:hypothetical protein